MKTDTTELECEATLTTEDEVLSFNKLCFTSDTNDLTAEDINYLHKLQCHCTKFIELYNTIRSGSPKVKEFTVDGYNAILDSINLEVKAIGEICKMLDLQEPELASYKVSSKRIESKLDTIKTFFQWFPTLKEEFQAKGYDLGD